MAGRGAPPAFKRTVSLARGITGYFKPVTCGASCSPAFVQWKQGGVLYEIADDAIQTPDGELPDSVVLRGVSEKLLWSHVAALPERCRTLLRVIAFADRPDYPELARSLGMPIGSIGPTRGRCLAKLRASLSADARWELR